MSIENLVSVNIINKLTYLIYTCANVLKNGKCGNIHVTCELYLFLKESLRQQRINKRTARK